MKKIHKILYSLFAFFACREANAAYTSCSTLTSPSGTKLNTYSTVTTSCTGKTTFYRRPVNTSGYVEYTHCTACSSGYKITSQIHSTYCPSITLQSCTPCSGCTNCSSKDWTSDTTNPIYQEKITASCDQCSGQCTKTKSYRCIAGYYGKPTNTSSGCYICPTHDNSAGTSTAGSNSTMTQCYKNSSITSTDTTGSYTFTNQCLYTS